MAVRLMDRRGAFRVFDHAVHVRVSPKELITATRVKYDRDTGGIEVYRSKDNGTSWQMYLVR